jgi:hypothetical protein
VGCNDRRIIAQFVQPHEIRYPKVVHGFLDENQLTASALESGLASHFDSAGSTVPQQSNSGFIKFEFLDDTDSRVLAAIVYHHDLENAARKLYHRGESFLDACCHQTLNVANWQDERDTFWRVHCIDAEADIARVVANKTTGDLKGE